jgi:hypothetical protein
MWRVLAWMVLLGACAEPATRSTLASVADAVVLDSRDGEVIFGRETEAPENADPDRVIRVDAQVPWIGGTEVIDARFVPGGIAIIATDHTLRVVRPSGSVVVDERAIAPLSVAGRFVAYAVGDPPQLEIARANIESGTVERMTQAMSPAWSPALSPDGRAIVFVSGVSGSPRLYRTDGGAPVALAPTLRTPSSPTAPVWRGDLLSFRDEQGEAVVSLSTGELR